MSNEITLEELLQQNAGSTIANFVADDRLNHTIENIRNGDSITEELLTDLKNRQDDINTVINSEISTIGTLDVITSGIIDSSFSDTATPNSTRQYKFSLIQKDSSNNRIAEGVASSELTITCDNGTKPAFKIFINGSVIGTHIRVYRNNTNGSTDFYQDGEISLNKTYTRFNLIPYSNIDSTSLSGNSPSELTLTIPSVYSSLMESRIQTGQLVDGLDALIQDNELDFNNRTKLIIEYTQ